MILAFLGKIQAIICNRHLKNIVDYFLLEFCRCLLQSCLNCPEKHNNQNFLSFIARLMGVDLFQVLGGDHPTVTGLASTCANVTLPSSFREMILLFDFHLVSLVVFYVDVSH